MTIKVRVRAIDGSYSRSFKTLAGAQRYAADRVGETPEFGSDYAVSFDGVVTVRVDGCTLAELFPKASAAEWTDR